MTTFAIPATDSTAANVRLSEPTGGWQNVGSVGGHTAILTNGSSCQIDTNITFATGVNTVQMTVFGFSTQPFDIYLDGVLQTRPTLSGTGAWVVVTILTNVTGAAHDITLKAIIGGTFYVDIVYGFNVTDVSPTIAPPSGFGPNYNLQASPFTSNSRTEGGFVSFSGGGLNYNWLDGPNMDMALSFTTDATSIKGWLFLLASATTVQIYQDGSPLGSPLNMPLSTASVQCQFVTFASGLSGSHNYEIHVVNGTVVGAHLFMLTSLMLVGGTGLITHTYPARDQYLFVGDSITQATVQTGSSLIGYPYKLGQTNSVGVINGGHNSYKSSDIVTELAGGLYLNYGSTYLKSWCLLIGTNDAATSVSTATFQSNMTSIMNSFQTAYGTTHGYVFQILPTTGYSVTAYNNVLAAAVAATTTGGTNITIVSIVTGPGGTFVAATDTADGIHPTAAGYNKLAPNIAAQIISAASDPIGSPDLTGGMQQLTGGI